jgi:hypothetical protein
MTTDPIPFIPPLDRPFKGLFCYTYGLFFGMCLFEDYVVSEENWHVETAITNEDSKPIDNLLVTILVNGKPVSPSILISLAPGDRFYYDYVIADIDTAGRLWWYWQIGVSGLQQKIGIDTGIWEPWVPPSNPGSYKPGIVTMNCYNKNNVSKYCTFKEVENPTGKEDQIKFNVFPGPKLPPEPPKL